MEIKFRFYSVAGMQAVEKIDFVNRTVTLSDGDTRSFDEGTLMQFSGRNDKNGVDIYAGDIVGIQAIRKQDVLDSKRKNKTKKNGRRKKIVKFSLNQKHIGFNIGTKGDEREILGNTHDS